MIPKNNNNLTYCNNLIENFQVKNYQAITKLTKISKIFNNYMNKIIRTKIRVIMNL